MDGFVFACCCNSVEVIHYLVDETDVEIDVEISINRLSKTKYQKIIKIPFKNLWRYNEFISLGIKHYGKEGLECVNPLKLSKEHCDKNPYDSRFKTFREYLNKIE